METKIYIKYIAAIVLLLGLLGYKHHNYFQRYANIQAKSLIEQANKELDEGILLTAYMKYTIAIALGDEQTDGWAYNGRGLVSYRQYKYWRSESKFQKSLKDYNKAISLSNVCYSSALYNKGLLYQIKGDYENALESFNQTLHCNPSDRYAKGEKTQLLFDLKRYQEAIDFGEQALKEHGENEYIQFAIAYSYEMLGNYKKAVEHYDKTLVNFAGNDYPALTNASYCKLKLKDYKGAIDYAKRSIELNSRNHHPYNFVALAALETGDLKTAIEYNIKAFVCRGTDYVSYYNDARIRLLQKDLEGAEEQLSQARFLFAKDKNHWKFDGFLKMCDELEQKIYTTGPKNIS